MNPSIGTFISMDSYLGSIYDPVSLHKYLYVGANPVMFTDPTGYSRLDETEVSQAGLLMIGASMLFAGTVALNIFSTLRKNMADTVMSLPCTVSVTDWKNVILGFPAHEFDTKWMITIPMALSSWQLFKAINDVKEADDEVETPGVPDNEEQSNDDNTVTSNQGNEYDNKPSDNHTVTDENPSRNQEPNSSVDIKDKNGNIVRRRWFDENGDAKRDLDYTNHGYPKNHPEVLHEHYWDWSKKPPRQ